MFDVITDRLLDWNSLILLALMVISFFSVAIFLSQEVKNLDTQNWTFRNFLFLAIEKTPQGRFDILILMGSSFFLYCNVLNLSRTDLSLTSFLLHFLASLFVAFIVGCAGMLGKWIGSKNSE